MIGTVDVIVQAANPDFPLTPFKAFVSSPSSVRVRNVPRRIGTWDITAVTVSVDYPDCTTETAACVLTAGVWVGTVPGCETPGDALRGFVVRADGVDENGDAVNGYVLGVGDVEILNRETALTPGVVTFKGDPGPQGERGPAGPQGPQGPKGDPGSGAVESVNGKVGAVELDGDDIEVGGGGDTRVVSGAIHENETKINSHIAEQNNPHGVTVDQIGAQKKLTAGENITITADGVISASGGGGGSVVESEANPGYAANADAANSVPWSGVSGKPTSFDPIVHSATHAANGADPVTPESIGALPKYGGTVSGNLIVSQTLSVGDSVFVAEQTGPGASDVSVRKGGKEVATEEQVGAAKDELNSRIDLIEATSHPNMTIVGSPTFREGNVSGFSSNDYLVFPTAVSVGQNTVEFHMAFHTGADVTTQQNLMDSWCGLAFAIRNGTTVTAISTNGTSFLAESTGGTVRANNSYRMKMLFSYEAGQYRTRVYLADGAGDFAEVGTGFTADAPVFATATYWGGANPGHATHAFGGIINLNECRMLFNGVEVWRGYDELPTVKFDPTATPRLDTAEKIAELSAYPIVSVVGGAVKDRTVNVCVGGGVITFPGQRVDGCVRDFLVRVPAMDTAPTVVFPSNVRYESWQDVGDIWTAEAGKSNEWYFSESEPGIFKVVHQALAVVAQ